MIPYLRQKRMNVLAIKDYIKVAKEIHTLVRKTGVKYDGVALDYDQRQGWQYL